MWDEIFSMAITNGIFACLFVALLVYELKDSRTREKKYQNTIDTLGNRLQTVNKISQDVDEIKKVIVYKKTKETKENA
jgi:hypothetical protein